MIRLQHLAFAAIALLTLAMLTPMPAHAQISNKPYSFGGGGIGMSDAARQAIINQKVDGSTPEVLLKDSSGQLLGLEKGPGGIPIVTGPDGQGLPGYRGRGWKGSDPTLNVGVFNVYFVRGRQDGPQIALAATSGQSVDAWTDTVYRGAPSGYGSSIDQWVAMAYYLGPRLR